VRSGVDKVWQLCREFASKQQGIKRKLVSLVEASEVAKRLAAKKGSREDEDEGEGVEMVEKNDGDEDEDVRGDEVDVWFHMGVNADY
jgi:hypothetical protein